MLKFTNEKEIMLLRLNWGHCCAAIFSLVSVPDNLSFRSIFLFATAAVMSSSLLTSRVAFAKDVLSKSEWISKAVLHKQTLDSLLYPGTDKRTSIKHRAHQISKHPIYNFLHTYYRYSVGDLRKYSPGVSAFLEEASLVEHRDILDENFMTFNDAGGHYTAACILQRESSGKRPDGKYAHMPLSAMRDILRATQERPPVLSLLRLA